MAKRKYGFITNKERAKRIRMDNQSYALRKILICVVMASLIALCVIVAVSMIRLSDVNGKLLDSNPDATAEQLIEAQSKDIMALIGYRKISDAKYWVGLSPLGIVVAVWAAVTIALGVWALVLVMMMRSPKQAKANRNRLQSAAISGKKLAAHANAAQVYRDRATIQKKKGK